MKVESMYQPPPPSLRSWSKGRAIALGFIIYVIGAFLIRLSIKLLLNDSMLLGLSIFSFLQIQANQSTANNYADC